MLLYNILLVAICKRKTLPIKSLEKYREKFKIFLGFEKYGIKTEDIKYGFSSKNVSELEKICEKLQIKKSNTEKKERFKYPKEKVLSKRVKSFIVDYKDSLILDIWIFLFSSINN